MRTRPLRNEYDASDDEDGNERSREWAADVQSAFVERFVEKVADGCTEWPRQDEGRPEQQNVRNRRPIVERRDDRKCRNKDERSACITEARRVGHPITERRTQCLRERNGAPIERLSLRCADCFDGDRALRIVPERQHSHQANE